MITERMEIYGPQIKFIIDIMAYCHKLVKEWSKFLAINESIESGGDSLAELFADQH